MKISTKTTLKMFLGDWEWNEKKNVSTVVKEKKMYKANYIVCIRTGCFDHNLPIR